MSLVSVLEYPAYAFQYPEGMNIVDSLVVRHIGAYKDLDTVGQDLFVGATSNLKLEGAENVQMYINPSGAFEYYTSEMSGVDRIDTKVLQVSAADASTTVITTSNQVLELFGGDAQATTKVSHTTMIRGIDESNQFMNVPTGEEFYFGNGVNIAGDVSVNGNGIIGRSLLVYDHLITYGNIYGCNLNLWRTIDSNLPENNSISQVGYGFRVNSNHQLELVKYSKFETRTVAKKVAVFGQTKFTELSSGDEGIEYSTLNDIIGENNLPEMPNASNSTVDLTKPIQTYWATGPSGIFYSAGNVGISNNNPEYSLDVNGTGRFESLLAEQSVIQQTTTTSDARLKDVLGAKSTVECFDAINRMRVTRYTYKDSSITNPFDGFIAQDVEDILPNAVSETKFKDIADCKTIDYNQILANLVGAVQHLSDLIADKLV